MAWNNGVISRLREIQISRMWGGVNTNIRGFIQIAEKTPRTMVSNKGCGGVGVQKTKQDCSSSRASYIQYFRTASRRLCYSSPQAAPPGHLGDYIGNVKSRHWINLGKRRTQTDRVDCRMLPVHFTVLVFQNNCRWVDARTMKGIHALPYTHTFVSVVVLDL
jgi:hypothetical protein